MTRQPTLWKCPACGRRFAKRNQWHSCKAQSVKHHFRGKDPKLRETYDVLITRLRELGPLRIDAVKSGINLASKYHFGGVSVRQDYLRVGFLSDAVIVDERIVKRERLGPAKVGYGVILRAPNDVDEQLLGWFKRAYELQSGRPARPADRSKRRTDAQRRR